MHVYYCMHMSRTNLHVAEIYSLNVVKEKQWYG